MSDKQQEIKKIDKVLDNTVRGAMMADGGNLEIIDYDMEANLLKIKYQGACGSCPMAKMGTLMAIQRALRENYNSEIEVQPID